MPLSAAASTLCNAFQEDLAAVREALEASPEDADLTAGEANLAAITADVCG